MKKLIFLYLLFPLYVSAQQLQEGKILYDISYQNLSVDMKRNEHMLPHDACFYFKNNRTRMEMGVGNMGKNSTIYNRETKVTTVLLYIMGKRFALIKNDSEMAVVKKEMSADTAAKTTRIEILDEYKTIADRNCRKALVHITSKGQTKTNECWFTTDIPPYNTENDEIMKGINGFLMQYTINENGMSMTMTVKLVMPIPIEDRYFEIPQGYQVVTESELNKILMVMQNNPSGY